MSWQSIYTVSQATENVTQLSDLVWLNAKKNNSQTLNLNKWAQNKEQAKQCLQHSRFSFSKNEQDKNILIKTLPLYSDLISYSKQDIKLRSSKPNSSINFKQHPWLISVFTLSAIFFAICFIGQIVVDATYLTMPSLPWLSSLVILTTLATFLLLKEKSTPLGYNILTSFLLATTLSIALYPLLLAINKINQEMIIWQTQIEPDLKVVVTNAPNLGRLDFNLSYTDGIRPNQKIDIEVSKGILGFYQTDKDLFYSAFTPKRKNRLKNNKH